MVATLYRFGEAAGPETGWQGVINPDDLAGESSGTVCSKLFEGMEI